MSKYGSPAFQFYPRDWLSDSKVLVMTPAERGIYITLLCHCWLDGTIPDDPPILAKLCGIHEDEMRRLWPAVRRCFLVADKRGNLYNKRLRQERLAQKNKSTLRKKAGSLGGKKRAENARDINNISSSANNLLVAKPSSSSSTSISMAASSKNLLEAPPPPTPPPVGLVSVEPKSRKSKTPYEQLPEWKREKFDEFWGVVWVRIGKQAAAEIFGRRARSPDEADRIIQAAKEQGPEILARAERTGGTALNPRTWLHQGRYDDELPPAPAGPRQTDFERMMEAI